MDIGVISIRYARALLKSASAANLEAQVYQDMMLLAKSYIDVTALRSTIDNPMLAKEKKQMLLETAIGGEESSSLSKDFIALVLKEGRENMIQFMANSYVTLYRQQKNIILGKLTTATQVSATIEQKMRSVVEGKTQGTVEFETQVDPDIIGGFVLEYDTYRMDASVKSKLNTILSTLKR
jgi:F-type H+-transporting ATPase subunit delta